jgi:hypothetical protein
MDYIFMFTVGNVLLLRREVLIIFLFFLGHMVQILADVPSGLSLNPPQETKKKELN